MLKYRDIIAPQVPIIIANVPTRTAAEAKRLGNTVGVVTEYNFSKTLELAQRLQPKVASRLGCGASDYDQSWIMMLVASWSPTWTATRSGISSAFPTMKCWKKSRTVA